MVTRNDVISEHLAHRYNTLYTDYYIPEVPIFQLNWNQVIALKFLHVECVLVTQDFLPWVAYFKTEQINILWPSIRVSFCESDFIRLKNYLVGIL
jgi:hypothetical protein